MTKFHPKKLRTLYGAAVSISICIAGICLIAACLSIYNGGNGEFSRDAVAAAFRPISIPVYLCLGLVILGFPLSRWLVPYKNPAEKQNAMILRRLHSKTDLSKCDESLQNAVAAEQKSRRAFNTVLGISCVLGAVIFMAYVLSGDRFQLPDINRSMVHAMCVLVPCLALPGIFAVVTVYHNANSVKKEIALLKQAAASAPRKQDTAPVNNCRKLNTARCVILALAVGILVFGFLTGGTADVLTKAINICTECVGLG